MPFILNNIRGAMKGIMAWAFAIVGIAAFSVVGVPSLSNFQQKPPIKVGSVSIGQQELMDAFNLELQTLQRQANRAFTREEAVTNGLPELIVADMSAKAVIQLENEKLGLAMPRTLARDTLRELEVFKNPLTGDFDENRFARFLGNSGYSARDFDRRFRQDLLRQTLVEAVSAGPDAPRFMADIFLARQTERRQVSWLSVTNEMAGEAIEPTAENLQAWYDDHPDAYTSPEYRTISVAFLRNTDFQEGLNVPEEELRKLYDINKTRLYEDPEKRTLYQLTYENEADAAAAVASLREGTPFENLARERGLSLEAATLTEAAKDDIVDENVRDATFAEGIDAGTILDPVKGIFGTTVVQVVDITPSTSRSFEEVRDELETAQLRQKTQKLVYDALELVETARDEGTSLAEAAASADVTIRTFGPVDRFSFEPGGAILDDIPGPALTEAFTLDEGEESGPIELDEGTGYLIVSVDTIAPPTLKAFEDVRDDVDSAWRADERQKRIATKTDEIVERVRAGETLETVAESFERAPISEALNQTVPNHETISQDLHRTIFTANKNDVVSGDSIGGTAKVVVDVRDITFARGSINPAELQSYRQFIGLQLNRELLEAYVTSLEQDYGVEINQKLIDRLFSVDGA